MTGLKETYGFEPTNEELFLMAEADWHVWRARNCLENAAMGREEAREDLRWLWGAEQEAMEARLHIGCLRYIGSRGDMVFEAVYPRLAKLIALNAILARFGLHRLALSCGRGCAEAAQMPDAA